MQHTKNIYKKFKQSIYFSIKYSVIQLFRSCWQVVEQMPSCAVLIPIFILIIFYPSKVLSNPGWKMVTGTPVSPEKAMQVLESSGRRSLGFRSSSGVSEVSETKITPEIEELARSLNHNPKLIFDYVRNHIDYVPVFGSVNGATATLLAGRGNDFDQTSLFIALMRASGYTTNYVIGTPLYAKMIIKEWLGVDESEIENVLASGGIPFVVSDDYPMMRILRVWAIAEIDGHEYFFDPAFKFYKRFSSVDLPRAMGYYPADFLDSAGGIIGTDYVQDIDSQNINEKLKTYSGNLISFINDKFPNAELYKIIGGREIAYEELKDYSVSLPWSYGYGNTDEWTEVSDKYRLKITIKYNGINQIFRSFEIAGKRVSLFHIGADNVPELRVNGKLIATGNPTVYGRTYDLNISVDHPYASDNGKYGDESKTFKLKGGASYNIVCDFGTVSKDMIKKHNTMLALNREANNTEQSEAVLGEALCIMGLTWMHELRLSYDIMAQLAGVSYVTHHAIGVMAQEKGYYIDVKLNNVSAISVHGKRENAAAWFRSSATVLSALEHGMLEQLQGSDKPGVSTVKLLQINNDVGNKTFFADRDNFSVIKGQLQNYSSGKINELQNAVNQGCTLILPEDAHIQLNDWNGIGYIQTKSDMDVGYINIGMIISGDYYGGYVSIDDLLVDTLDLNDEIYLDIKDFSSDLNLQTPQSEEPVDMASGAYLFDSTDLSMGKAEPLGLSFTRSYNSSAGGEKLSMGYGCTHNYDIYLESHTHAELALGKRLPMDAAGTIAGFYVLFDIMKNHDDLQGWLAGCLASKWVIDQFVDNAVTVHSGINTMEYIKLVDGTYSPPPGVKAKLIKTDDRYILKDRFDVTYKFNDENKISEITDADGNVLTFLYSGDELQSVQDAFGRTFTFEYTGDFIGSVTDSAGRSVEYSYDDGNLISYIDPENNIWSYGYDDRHRMTDLTNPVGITTAANTYDSLGRVKIQTVPRKEGNVSYNFYFSGFRNVEEDPEGHQTVYYFDEKGRTLYKENALGNKSKMVYDAQNHLVKATDPRGNTTRFNYDGNHNLTEIIDPLCNKVSYEYDRRFRLIETKDPLGHNVEYTYDSKNHQLTKNTYPEPGKTIVEKNSYLSNGLNRSFTDGRGIITYFNYDRYGNPVLKRTGHQFPVTYVYNNMGKLVRLTDQAGATTRFEYDNRGLLTVKTDPFGRKTRFAYYDDGRLRSRTDRNYATVTYTYTPSGKLDTINYPDSSSVSLTYDLLDNLTEMNDSLGTTHYNYDAAGRLISTTDPNDFTVSYKYDKVGNLTELTYPGGKKVNYTYDELNRLKTVTNWLGETATYTYDNAGRLTGLDQFNGTWTSYGYDNANRITDLQNRKDDSCMFPDNGNNNNVNRVALSWNQNTNSCVISTYHFTLDNNGNRTYVDKREPLVPDPDQVQYHYIYNNQRNRLVSADNLKFNYDFEGQLTKKGQTVYKFDYEHRMTRGDGEFFYDGAGNRLKAVRNGVITRYIYDAAGNLLAEADSSNRIIRYYIYGHGLLAMMTPSDNIYCYHFNATGSTIAMTDQNQNMVNKYAYTPFGIIANQTETVPQPFKYIGQYGVMSEPNGLYYMRARYYDPQSGRFISEDPMGFDGGDVNLYAYVQNNPIMFIDPLGLYSFQQFLKETAAYSGIAATASFLTPGGQNVAIVFAGIATASVGLEIGLYSEKPYIDTFKETIKMILPVKKPYDIFTDKAVDMASEKTKNFMNKKQTSCGN